MVSFILWQLQDLLIFPQTQSKQFDSKVEGDKLKSNSSYGIPFSYKHNDWIREVVKSWPCEWDILIEDDKQWNKWKSCEKWEFSAFIMSHNVTSPVWPIIQECFQHNTSVDNYPLIIWMSVTVHYVKSWPWVYLIAHPEDNSINKLHFSTLLDESTCILRRFITALLNYLNS